MQFTVSDVVQIILMLLGMLGWSFGLYRFIISRHDEDVEKLHARINSVRDEYVRREDFLIAMHKLDEQFNGFTRALSEHNATVTQRIDRILDTIAASLATQNNGKSGG